MELVSAMEGLATLLQLIYDRWRDFEAGISFTRPGNGLFVEKESTGRRGRPKYVIKEEQMIFLRELRLTWTIISEMYGISRRTMYNIRSGFGLVGSSITGFTNISNTDLRCLIHEIKQEMPHIGVRMLRGVLESRGYHIPTTRLRDTLEELEPLTQWSAPIRRRVYSVPYPNALWHIDGNHKLVR
jgi:hypothetical protein